MLRARKKDARIKPNRKLDKRSSRGMLYENEELRLRTIEINAEVERGQTDIKKLRKENEHLRREMWALRDEYDRLEKLIKNLDLAGTGSEHQRGHQHSDGEGRGGGRRSGQDDDDEDDDEDDDDGPLSLNGCGGESKAVSAAGSGDEDAAHHHRHHHHHSHQGDPIPRSKSQTVLPESRHPVTPAAATVVLSPEAAAAGAACHCPHLEQTAGGPGTSCSGFYVECGNPDMDNIENYQKAYGRMPGRSASASPATGGKIYVTTQHIFPHQPGPSGASGRVGCYESLAGAKVRYSGSGMEDEDGYAACSHPATGPGGMRMNLRDFLTPAGDRTGGGTMPPQPSDSPPPLPPPLRQRLDVRRAEDKLTELPEESTGSEEEAAAGCGEALGAADTPSEDDCCHLNLDHLVDVVQSFRQEQQLHQSGMQIVPAVPVISRGPPGSRAGSVTPSQSAEIVVIEENDDDDDEPHSSSSSSSSSSPEVSGLTTIKRRPIPPVRPEHLRHRQVAIIEREPLGLLESAGSGGGGNAHGGVGGGGLTLRRSSFSSSSSSVSGSPTGTTVVFLNNNNNNNNNLNNKSGGSSGQLNKVMSHKSSSSSPIRIALPPPSTVAISSAEPSRDPNGEEDGAIGGSGCLSVYPLPDGDASASLLRLHAVDPFTVSFDLSKQPEEGGGPAGSLKWAGVTVQEVIDQLERQVDSSRCQVRGVRVLAGSLFFISLDSARSVRYLMRHTFKLRGQFVRLTDVSAHTCIVSLTGVPHYISDATVGLLLDAFGTIVGDVERRFFRGMDTGERLVRFRLKGYSTKLPRHITVGGCRIQVRRLSPASNSSEGSRSRSVSNPTGMDRRMKLYGGGGGGLEEFDPDHVEGAGPEDVDVKLDGQGGAGKSGPKIGRSFEYRSQLRVDLRMSAEVPAPPGSVEESPVAGTSSRITPPGGSCAVCEQAKRQTPPAFPPSVVIHRCRSHHHHGEAGSNCATPAASTAAVPSTLTLRESPPKSRASVNFEDVIVTGGRPGNTARMTGKSNVSTTATCNGILRKSVSGDEPNPEGGGPGGGDPAANPGTANPSSSGTEGAKPAPKKTARSFSLADTFRVNRERRSNAALTKPLVRVETVVESSGGSGTGGTEVVAVVQSQSQQRRDSAESSSRSSRSSRKSNELPWCGCWGNGCL